MSPRPCHCWALASIAVPPAMRARPDRCWALCSVAGAQSRCIAALVNLQTCLGTPYAEQARGGLPISRWCVMKGVASCSWPSSASTSMRSSRVTLGAVVSKGVPCGIRNGHHGICARVRRLPTRSIAVLAQGPRAARSVTGSGGLSLRLAVAELPLAVMAELADFSLMVSGVLTSSLGL
jgi:hypothetical protein